MPSKVAKTETTALSEETFPDTTYKVYNRRWLILFLFVISCASSTVQWTQYSIIANVLVKYYDVSYKAAEWTAVIYLLFYLLLIFPGSFLLYKLGFRIAMLLAMLGTTMGAWVKVGSVAPHRFWVVLLGQSLVAASQVFLLSTPARLAAIWFSSEQVSVACSIGVIGIQMGIGIGFLLPPIFVNDHETTESIERGFYTMLTGIAIVNSVILIALFIFFKEKPPTPPSAASLQVQTGEDSAADFLPSVKRIITNPSFLLLIIAFGISSGTYYAVTMLLNIIVLEYYPSAALDAGRIGLVVILSGLVGSITAGLALDRYKRYKVTLLVLYGIYLGAILVLTLIYRKGIAGLYIVLAVLGFAAIGSIPVGFEIAVELTHPESEATSVALLTAAGELFGIIFTNLYSYLFSSMGIIWANLILAVMLLLAILIIICVRFELRRQITAS